MTAAGARLASSLDVALRRAPGAAIASTFQFLVVD